MAKTSLRILFMNLENLFSPGKEFYGSQYTPAEYADKVNWIGSMIAESQVHIAALTELGEDSKSCIEDVMKAANEKDTTTRGSFQAQVPRRTGQRQYENPDSSDFPL